MSRLLGVDYGNARCGVAVTDTLQISINPLGIVAPADLLDFLKKYIADEEVSTLIIGWPKHKDGKETYLVDKIKTFLISFAEIFPDINIERIDESFSSIEARSIIYQSGVKKKKKRNKGLVDQIGAVLIIKRYLDRI